MTKIHHNFIEVDNLRPWKEYSYGVFLAPADAGCTPTAAEIVDGSLSDSGVPDGGTVTATYRIDDGPTLTVTGTLYAVNGLMKTDLIQDFLLPEIMDSRWLHDYGDPEFRGGDGSDGGEPATLHLLLTPGADYDAVQILFGGPVDIHSCGEQQFAAEL